MTTEIHELDITDGLNRELYNHMVILRNELLEKIDKLEKKLDIAVKALEWYAQPDESLAQEALKQIKEIK